MRRYFIHKYQTFKWTLVFDVRGQWHVEKAGPHGICARFTLEEFEKSDHGRQLADRLSRALQEAEQDA